MHKASSFAPRAGQGLGQIPFVDANPFPNIVPSPASAAAAAAWQPTEEAKHLPDLSKRVVAGAWIAGMLIGLTVFSSGA